MGMTDRQFDAYRAQLLDNLKVAAEETPNNKKLLDIIAKLEVELSRP